MARIRESRTNALLLLLLGAAQIALAIGIIAVISRELWHVTAYRTGSWRYNYVYGECFMQSNYGASKTNLCRYVYGTSGMAVVGGIVIVILQFVSCGQNGVNGCAVLLSTVYAIWWAVTASLVTANAHWADSDSVGQQKYRHIVVGLCWGELLLFTLAFLIDMASFCTQRGQKPQAQIPMGTYTNTYQPQPGAYPNYPPPPPGVYPAPAGAYPYAAPATGYPVQQYANVNTNRTEV